MDDKARPPANAGEYVSWGDEISDGTRMGMVEIKAQRLLARLDAPDFKNLKTRFEAWDELTKNKFLADFGDASTAATRK